jgi:hypothetical protein
MKTVFVRPAKEGAVVPDPDTNEPLKAEGEYKPQTRYWRDRISLGEVQLVNTKRGKQK